MASLGQPPRRFTIRVAATSPATCACASSKIHPTSVSSDFSVAAQLPAPVFRCVHQRLLGCGSAAEIVRARPNGAALLLVPDQSD
jgi:hypothetical protein